MNIVEMFLNNFKVFQNNEYRYSILYYLAKQQLQKKDDTHTGKMHSILTSKLSTFRRERTFLPDNELYDFLIWCYFIDKINYKIISVFKKAHIYTMEDLFKDNLIEVLNTNELTKNIELNHLANCLMFQRESKELYEVYRKQLSDVPNCQSELNERKGGRFLSLDPHTQVNIVQAIGSEIHKARRECVTYYSKILGTSDKPGTCFKS